jgi:hypothetical protein
MEDNVKPRIVTIDYTNYKNQRNIRNILPMQIFFGKNNFHEGSQWFLEAMDYDKTPPQVRHFALKDIHSWKACD